MSNAIFSGTELFGTDYIRYWFQNVCPVLEAGGLERTEDTGQLDPETATHPFPSNGDIGYEIRRFTDELADTDPVYVRFDYYRASPNSVPATYMKFTFGTGSDGSGNLINSVEAYLTTSTTSFTNPGVIIGGSNGSITSPSGPTYGKQFQTVAAGSNWATFQPGPAALAATRVAGFERAHVNGEPIPGVILAYLNPYITTTAGNLDIRGDVFYLPDGVQAGQLVRLSNEVNVQKNFGGLPYTMTPLGTGYPVNGKNFLYPGVLRDPVNVTAYELKTILLGNRLRLPKDTPITINRWGRTMVMMQREPNANLYGVSFSSDPDYKGYHQTLVLWEE